MMYMLLLLCVLVAAPAAGFLLLAWAGDMYDRRDVGEWRMTNAVVARLHADLTARLRARRAEMGAQWVLHPAHHRLPLWLAEQAL